MDRKDQPVTGFQRMRIAFTRTPLFRIGLPVAGVLLLLLNDGKLAAAAYDVDDPPLLVLAPVYLIGFLSLIPLLLNKNAAVRTVARILLFSALYTDVLYLIIGRFPFSYPDAINLFNNPEYASGAISTFGTAFLLAFAGAAGVFVLLMAGLSSHAHTHRAAWIWLFAALQGILFLSSGMNPGLYDFMPAVYRVSGNLLTADRFRPEETWQRKDVAVKPVITGVRHLFLVVDESIAGTVLSVNGFPLPTTPFLQRHAPEFINFGLAGSFTNASAGSNLSLLSGMQFRELPDKEYHAFSKPGLFRFAKKAGYRTYLLDGQSAGGRLQNYTTAHDLRYVDSLIQPASLYPALSGYARDSLIAEIMACIAAGPEPTLVYVNKAGAHWPYVSNYPAGLPGKGLSVPPFNRHKNALPYFKSVYWNVDKFWERLTGRLMQTDSTLILYTSDHGEHYAARPFQTTHASIYAPQVVEGIVPLLAYDRAGFFPRGFSPHANRYTHEYIFPTLLRAMGYDSTFIKVRYGKSLLEAPDTSPRWFQSGDLFGRGRNRHVVVDSMRAN